jgi:hypothetical protein
MKAICVPANRRDLRACHNQHMPSPTANASDRTEQDPPFVWRKMIMPEYHARPEWKTADGGK